MKVIDALGSELVVGDTVSVRMDFIVGTVVKVETGDIVKGLILDGKPAGQQLPPHVVIQIGMNVPTAIVAPPGSPVGQVPGVLKVVKPVQKTDGQ